MGVEPDREKDKSLVETDNETSEPMKLWTGFGDDDTKEPDDIVEPDGKTTHPNHRTFRGNYRQRGNRQWRSGYPRWNPHRDKRFRADVRRHRRKWMEWISMKENEWNRNFFEDDFLPSEEGFSTVTFDNDQFHSETKTDTNEENEEENKEEENKEAETKEKETVVVD